MASEEMSFENVARRWMPGYTLNKLTYEPKAQVMDTKNDEIKACYQSTVKILKFWKPENLL